MTTHNYNKSIVESELKTIPDSFYQNFLGDNIQINTIPRNHVLQIKGRLDKIITFSDGRQIVFEEKCRNKDYGDMLIEEKSAMEYNTDGWILKPSLAQFLVYYIHSTSQGYIYNLPELQTEWAQRGDFLKTMGRRCEAANETYTTLNWAIPFRLIKSKCFIVNRQN